MRNLLYCLFILFISIAAYPQTTIFNEDFNKPTWAADKDKLGPFYSEYIHDGSMEISNPDNSTDVGYWVKNIPLPEEQDYYLEAMMTWQKGKSELYGICWDFEYDKDDNTYSYYFFGIGEDSYYLAHKKLGKGVKILKNEAFPAIYPGINTTNKLTIYRNDDKFKFYINDLFAAEMDYEDIDNPNLGLMIHCGQNVLVDYFCGKVGSYPFAGIEENTTNSKNYSGYGISTYGNNERYAGKFENGKRSGPGTFYSNSRIYSGVWSNDSMCNGTIYYMGNQTFNGIPVYKYQGDWKNFLWDGEGSVLFCSNSKLLGFFSKGDVNYEAIVNGTNYALKAAAASDSLTPPGILFKLASESDYNIRYSISQNKSSELKTLLKLVSEGNTKLKIFACLNDNMYSSISDSIMETIKFDEFEKELSAELLKLVFNKIRPYFLYSIINPGSTSSNSVTFPLGFDLINGSTLAYTYSKTHLGKETYLGTSTEGTAAYNTDTKWIEDYQNTKRLSLDNLLPVRFIIRSDSAGNFYFPAFKNMGYNDIYGERTFPIKITGSKIILVEKCFSIFESIHNKRKAAGWDIVK